MLQRLVGPQTAAAMTLLKHIPDAQEAKRLGLVLDTVDGDHDALVAAAVALAGPAAEAPRDLVMSTKRTLKATAAMSGHDGAIAAELTAQVASMETPEFAALLAAMKARITKPG
jgi:enoyl-CoA hydratase